MKDKLIAYPAIFKPLKNDAFFVSFPDLPNTFTEGHGFDDALLMASDVLAEMNYDNKHLPSPSYPKDIGLENDGSFVAIVAGNLSAKKREFQKYVHKNVTVPTELAQAAEEENINFSQTLTEALKEKLGVQ